MPINDKNILIIVPRVVSRAGDWYQPPLGLAYISSVLKNKKFNVANLNLNDSDIDFESRIENAIKKNNTNYVLTGGVTGQYSSIANVLKISKNIKPDITTIVGGGIITSLPIEGMEALEYADYGVIGEGEVIIVDLLENLILQTDIHKVPGVVYKLNKRQISINDSGIVKNSLFKRTSGELPIIDLNNIPYPDYDGIGYSQLVKAAPNILGMSETNTLPIITSRGCPFQCTFCFQPDGQSYRLRDLDDVFSEIDYLIREYNVKYLSVTDELFGARKGRVEEFCARIKPYNIKWTATFRIPQLTPVVVKMLKESNFHTASLGIESMDDKILKSMKKKITRTQIETGLKLLHDEGIGIQGVLIFGDPAETRETAQNTLNWWMENIEYDLQLSAIIAYPGTPVYDHAIANGLIKDPVKFIRDGCPLIKLSSMSDDDYSWLFGQILSLPREKYSIPNNFTIAEFDFNNGKFSASGECVHCNSKNTWIDIRAFMLESMTCTNCGRRHISPIPHEFIVRISNNFNRISAALGRVAFWGINSYFYHFVKESAHLLNDFHLVDQGETRVGVVIKCADRDVIVENTAILGGNNIKCVIVSVPNYYATIQKTIPTEHPDVEFIFSIVDLLSENFSIQAVPNILPFNRPDLESSVSGKIVI